MSKFTEWFDHFLDICTLGVDECEEYTALGILFALTFIPSLILAFIIGLCSRLVSRFRLI